MKMPRPRPTVRRLMIAVALVACGFWLVRLRAARQLYLEKAAISAALRANVLRTRQDIAYWEARWTSQREGQPASYPWPAAPPFVPAITDYYDAKRRKYERAARYPWLSVEPDPL